MTTSTTATTVDKLTPGTRIRVEQRVERRAGVWSTQVEGVIEKVHTAPTGSWFAHGPSDRYLLKRITLRKADGERTLIALDEKSRVTILPEDA
ncbi:MAG: hypothetical protein H6817_06880 [Phycisphaerales bacterium]|nr:hypothetical protein [Phycisphaerales bacterium]